MKGARRRRVGEIVRAKLAFERRFIPAVTAALKASARSAASAYRDHGQRGADDALDHHRKAIADVIERLGVAAALHFAGFVRDAVKTFRPKHELKSGAFEVRVKRFIAHHALNKAQQITDRSKKLLRGILSTAVDKGFSTDDTTRAIEAHLATPARAAVIARTEVHTASNVGMHEQAVETNLEFTKVWGATEDLRTRESHAIADGQRRAMREPFSVGGASLMFPGDPAGPAKEVINCRCVTLYEPESIE